MEEVITAASRNDNLSPPPGGFLSEGRKRMPSFFKLDRVIKIKNSRVIHHHKYFALNAGPPKRLKNLDATKSHTVGLKFIISE